MAKMNLSKMDYRVIEPNYYEAAISGVEEVKNPFYNPNEPDESKRGTETQYKVKFDIPDVDGSPFFISAYFSPVLSPNSKLNKLCTAVIEGFTLEHDLDDQELIGKKLRINVTVKKNKDGDDRNIISDFLPLKKKA